MGVMVGYKQVSLYVDPDLYARASHVAKMLDEPLYEFVNKALAAAVEQRTTPEQRKAVDVLVGGTTPSGGGGKKHEPETKTKNGTRPRR